MPWLSRGCTRIFRDLTYWCSLKCHADTFKDGVVAGKQARPLQAGALQCLKRGFCSRIKTRSRSAISYPIPPPSTLLFIFFTQEYLRLDIVLQKGYAPFFLSLSCSLARSFSHFFSHSLTLPIFPSSNRKFCNENRRHDLFFVLAVDLE